MSIVNAAAAPCWILDPIPADAEWWAHYLTEEEARRGLDEDEERVPKQMKHHCVTVRCDERGLYFHPEEYPTEEPSYHLEPDEVSPWLDGTDWTSYDFGRHHRCAECPLPPDDEEDDRRRPGPDDIPLPLEVSS